MLLSQPPATFTPPDRATCEQKREHEQQMRAWLFHRLEQQITFTAGHTPRQLTSDNDVAASLASGEITLTLTNQVYRCSVVGKP